METQELHRGRLIDHIQLVVRDLPAARAFYGAIFDVLNIPIGGTGDDFFWADELFVSTSDSQAAQGILTGRHHLAFQTQSRTMVDKFYKAALANGGKDNGAPGERAYHPGYYATFVLDPDGNNIEAVYHGEANRSSPSVHITFQSRTLHKLLLSKDWTAKLEWNRYHEVGDSPQAKITLISIQSVLPIISNDNTRSA